MSFDETIIFRVNVAGFKSQDFRVSSKLLLSFGNFPEVDEAIREGMIVSSMETNNERIRAGWRGFFEYIHRGSFTIPELFPAATGLLAGNRADNIWHVEEEIFHAYDIAQEFGLVDFQNKIMDALYDKGRLSNKHLSPSSMRYILERLDPNSTMQTYCAVTIALILSRKDYVNTRRVILYANLAADIPALAREVFLYQAECAVHDRTYPDRVPQVHMYCGYCDFHQHPNGEECYLDNEFRPWGQVDDESESGAEVEMEDTGTQTEDVIEGNSNGQARREDRAMQTEENMEGDNIEVRGEDCGIEVNEDRVDISSDDSEEDIPAVKKRKKCNCSESARKYIGHKCR